MTEATPIDVSGKIISNAKPAAPSPAGPPGAAKPPEKPSAKGATGERCAARAGQQDVSRLGRRRVFPQAAYRCRRRRCAAWPPGSRPCGLSGRRRTTDRGDTIASLRPGSCGTGDAGHAAANRPHIDPRTSPARRIHPAREAADAAGFARVCRYVARIPPPSGLDTLPLIPSPGPTPPSDCAARPPTIAPPDSLVPAVLPAGGTDDKLPAIPSSPGSILPAVPPRGPMLPVLPSGPASTPPAPMNLDPRARAGRRDAADAAHVARSTRRRWTQTPGRARGAEPDVAGDSRSERRKTRRLEARVRQACRELER